MMSAYKFSSLFLIILLLSSCNYKKPEPAPKEKKAEPKVIPEQAAKESIEGIYETKPDENNFGECKISLEITKTKDGYSYFLKTKNRQLKGIATFTIEKSGGKYLVLEGIKWDEYEGDISNEEENDSISESGTTSKELEIPVGIDVGYVKDTLTFQNYGNSMNSYTKLSECARKHIELIKSQK